jgi:hypothetical protein
MSTQKPSPEKLTTLQHLERIIDLSEKNGLDENFFVKAKKNLEYLSMKFTISPLQAALFALFVDCGDDTRITPDDIANKAKWKTIKILQFMNDFDELIRKKLLASTNNEGLKRFRVTPLVMNALIKNSPIEIEIKATNNLDIFEFFDVLETLVDQRGNNEINSADFIFEINRLVEENKRLNFSQAVKNHRLKENLQATLLFLRKIDK